MSNLDNKTESEARKIILEQVKEYAKKYLIKNKDETMQKI